MRKRVADQQVPGGGVLGGDGDPGAGDLSWAPPDEAPAEPSFEEMWEKTANMELEDYGEPPAGGDVGGVQQPDPPLEDVPALPEAQESGVAESDVPEGPGGGVGADLIEISGERIFAEPAGTSPTKALTKLIKDKKERKMPKTDTKSPEHREKLRKALKAYWAKRRKEGAGNTGGKPKKAKVKAKVSPKPVVTKAPRPVSPADNAAAALTAAYATYHAAVKAAKETLRKTVASIVDKA